MKKIIQGATRLLLIYLFISSFSFFNITYAKILIVPSEYSTIQTAIDAAGKGDTVYVLKGTYNYTSSILLKSFLHIIGEDNQNTVINGNGTGTAFSASDDEAVYIENLKIKNYSSAVNYDYNAGPFQGDVSIVVRNNTMENFTYNCVFLYWNSYSNKAVIDNNTFRNCYTAVHTGRADQSVIISNNFIYGCNSGIDVDTYSGPLIINNVVARSKTNGISVSAGNAKIINNTVVFNGNAGIYITHNQVPLRNNIVCYNGIGISDYYSGTIGDYNNVFGNTFDYGIPKGEHDISYDPLFADTLTYQLSPNSPCIDAGDPYSDYDKEPYYNGGRINLGAYGNTNKTETSRPEIAAPGNLYFYTLNVGETDTTVIWIRNTGLTRLNVELSYPLSQRYFSFTANQDFILSNDSMKIKVVFKPDSLGVFESNLFILSNDEDESNISIHLTGICNNTAGPVILNISDIPNDQGGWVKVNFSKSSFDTDSLILGKVLSPELYTIEIDDGSGWTAAASSAAYGKSIYSVLVPTTQDSTSESNGLIYFRVIAAMNEGNYLSSIITGYSVDNLFPAIPSGLAAMIDGGNVRLSWKANEDDDFKYYTIYRSTGKGVYKEIGNTIDPSFLDNKLEPELNYGYAVTASDFSGNESNLSKAIQIIITGINYQNSIPVEYSLFQNYPNPFNPVTKINWQTPEGSAQTLKVYNSLGKEIACLVNEYKPAGKYEVEFDASRLASGVYYYRLHAGNYIATRKFTLIK